MMYMPDCLKATVNLLEADPSVLKYVGSLHRINLVLDNELIILLLSLFHQKK